LGDGKGNIADFPTSTIKPITLTQVIPQREAWLHKTPKAKASVLRGLKQAKTGKRAKSPPDLDADSQFVEQLDD
jgi:hypothetical protein